MFGCHQFFHYVPFLFQYSVHSEFSCLVSLISNLWKFLSPSLSFMTWTLLKSRVVCRIFLIFDLSGDFWWGFVFSLLLVILILIICWGWCLPDFSTTLLHFPFYTLLISSPAFNGRQLRSFSSRQVYQRIKLHFLKCHTVKTITVIRKYFKGEGNFVILSCLLSELSFIYIINQLCIISIWTYEWSGSDNPILLLLVLLFKLSQLLLLTALSFKLGTTYFWKASFLPIPLHTFSEHFLTFWYPKILQIHSACTFCDLALEPVISPGSPGSFNQSMILETKIWVSVRLSAPGVSTHTAVFIYLNTDTHKSPTNISNISPSLCGSF